MTLRHKRALEWRANHHHEPGMEEQEVPTIVESGSSNERAFEDYGEGARQRIGFY